MKTHSSPARWRDVGNYQAWRDHAGERTVEAALDLQRHCGTAYAAQYLYSNNIALPVALRTLKQADHQRRLATAKLAAAAQALSLLDPVAALQQQLPPGRRGQPVERVDTLVWRYDDTRR